MQKRRFLGDLKLILLAGLIAINGTHTALAVTSVSPNYQVSEFQVGGGSMLESCSDQYCARGSAGDSVTGTSKNSKNTTTFGSAAGTDSDPLLEVTVEEGESDLGIFTTESTAVKTANVHIRTHLSNGYILQLVGDPPKHGDHMLKTPTIPTASQPGKEQFGINAVANTVPVVGADPQQIPSGQISFGVVEDDYKVSNMFKYVSGNVIARSSSESGRTDYTISMIVNVSNATPAGHYSGEFSAVVVPIY